MQPLLRGTLAVVALGALVRVVDWVSPAPPRDVRVRQPALPSASARASPCPPGTLPDGRACIPAQAADRAADGRRSGPAEGPEERAGWPSSDWIPKGPDRPAELERYQLPLHDAAEAILGSYDLGPGRSEPASGPKPELCWGVEIAATHDSEVRAVAVRDQQGDAEVLDVSPEGPRLVLLYATSQPASYLLLYRGLGETAPALEKGARLKPSALLGSIGSPRRAGLVHLCLEARKLRERVDPRSEPIARLVESALSLPTDPRNVLTLR